MKYTVRVEKDNTFKGKWMVVIRRGEDIVGIPARDIGKGEAEARRRSLSFAFGFGFTEAKRRMADTPYTIED